MKKKTKKTFYIELEVVEKLRELSYQLRKPQSTIVEEAVKLFYGNRDN